MAAPTQALPSYLSFSTSLITQPGGAVVTSSTLVELPLTYFGRRASVLIVCLYVGNTPYNMGHERSVTLTSLSGPIFTHIPKTAIYMFMIFSSFIPRSTRHTRQ